MHEGHRRCGGGRGSVLRLPTNDDDTADARDGTRTCREAGVALRQRRHQHGEARHGAPPHRDPADRRASTASAATRPSATTSVQRRHQKLVEETPSPVFTAMNDLREEMGQAAIAAGEAVKYEGVGTVEFLVDADRNFYCMEMNIPDPGRLQHHHRGGGRLRPRSSRQTKLAHGDAISGRNYYPKMHAIQCRINAEDPDRNFAPSPGTVTDYHGPGGHGIRDRHPCLTPATASPRITTARSPSPVVVAQTREEAITEDGSGPSIGVHHRRRQDHLSPSPQKLIGAGRPPSEAGTSRPSSSRRKPSGLRLSVSLREKGPFSGPFSLECDRDWGQPLSRSAMAVVLWPGTKSIVSTRPPLARTSTLPTMYRGSVAMVQRHRSLRP